MERHEVLLVIVLLIVVGHQIVDVCVAEDATVQGAEIGHSVKSVAQRLITYAYCGSHDVHQMIGTVGIDCGSFAAGTACHCKDKMIMIINNGRLLVDF